MPPALCITVPVLTGHQLSLTKEFGSCHWCFLRLCPAPPVTKSAQRQCRGVGPTKPKPLAASCSRRLMSFRQCQTLSFEAGGLGWAPKNTTSVAGRRWRYFLNIRLQIHLALSVQHCLCSMRQLFYASKSNKCSITVCYLLISRWTWKGVGRSHHTEDMFGIAARSLCKLRETLHTSSMSIPREITKPWLSCLKQNRLHKHTNKQTLLQLPGLMLFLAILMQTENLLAHDGHQKIFGPPEHLTSMTSYVEGCPGIL